MLSPAALQCVLAAAALSIMLSAPLGWASRHGGGKKDGGSNKGKSKGSGPKDKNFPPFFIFTNLTLPIHHPEYTDPSLTPPPRIEDTFQLHYHYNTEFFRHNGTIFFVPGDQRALDTESREQVEFLWDIAPLFNAAIVVAEQRFYGASQPFPLGSRSGPTWSWQQLAYLDSFEIMYDYSQLLDHFIENELDGAKAGMVVSAGVGYSGVFARWHNVILDDGGWNLVSGAPLLYFRSNSVPPGAYDRLATAAIGKYCDLDELKRRLHPVIEGGV